MSLLGGEKYSIQEPIINYLSQSSQEYKTFDKEKFYPNLGWEYIKPDEALKLRGGETGFIFKEVFIKQMIKLNSFMTQDLAEDLIRQLERIPSNIEGNLIAWEYLKGLKTIFVPSEKRERNVKFIDTENIDNNIFQITDEFEFTNGTKTIRPDIVFLINGIPIFLIETKSAHKIDAMGEALEQVKRYHQECPEIMAILQIFAITHLIKFYYGATWNTSAKSLINWKEETEGDFETLVKTFFDKRRVVKILTDFILFARQDGELKKVVLRPHQMRAVDKIIERASSDKKRGLIWHTQGSGKTYTMIVSALKIIENPIFNNPTVIMLVDRNELESQLFGNIKSLGIKSVEVVENKKDLREILSNDKRGLIIATIQKFEGMPQNINTRDNIFILVDEAHRTTGGKLGNYLMGALPNATYIGFTGTPIDKTKHGTGTFVIFGKDDPPHGYLDKYGISESIEDGTTAPLHYTLAPNELQVDKETLEKEFLNIKDAEGISDIEELNNILEKAVNLKNMLKSRDRISKIAEFIAKHYKEYIEPMGYKAFVVAVDREACALYKEELDKHLPEEYSKVVYSSSNNDPPELKKYHISEDEEQRIRKAFRKPDELPKILIVTDKLLTGFDAPILYCMYLDKPMRDHILLQAIARVNRPYEDDTGWKKPCGFVLDFVGIFDKLEKALAFDSTDISGIVQDINVLKESFAQKIENGRNNYLSIIRGNSPDKKIEAILEYFRDEEKRHEYYQFFSDLSDMYEIISPDAFLRPFMEDYETFARIYKILKEAYEPNTLIDKEFTKKTAQLVQQHAKVGEIKPSLDIYEINEDTLRKIEESKVGDTEKVFNLIKSIRHYINKESLKSPYLISIGKRVERILESYKERQKNTQETLEELKKLTEEINSARKEEVEKNMPVEIFSIYWILKEEGFTKAEELANQMQDVLDNNPYWYKSNTQERTVLQELYLVLIQSGEADVEKVSNIASKIIDTLKKGVKK